MCRLLLLLLLLLLQLLLLLRVLLLLLLRRLLCCHLWLLLLMSRISGSSIRRLSTVCTRSLDTIRMICTDRSVDPSAMHA